MSLIFLPCVTGPLASSGQAGTSDPFFSSVVILSHFDGTNGSQSFVDSSSIANNPTTSGSAALTTTSPLFGTASLQAGSNPVSCSSNPAYAIGTGDFTWEFAFNTASPSQVSNLCDCGNLGLNPTQDFVIYTLSGSYHYFVAGTDKIVGGSIPTNTWQRISVVRISGTTTMFVDGISVGSFSDSTSYVAGLTSIAGAGTGSSQPTGKFDEWRFTNGVGRYSGNYTPATAPFPDF